MISPGASLLGRASAIPWELKWAVFVRHQGAETVPHGVETVFFGGHEALVEEIFDFLRVPHPFQQGAETVSFGQIFVWHRAGMVSGTLFFGHLMAFKGFDILNSHQ